MQISRLFEIVYILLDKKKISAGELAEHFEVSVRTIYRDIDVLCNAGIPIYMSKGKGGGISLLDSFVLNKSILSDKDQNEILTALQSLNAIKYPDVDNVLSRLGILFNKSDLNWIDVDFSHWGEADKEKFNLIKTAIVSKKVINFEYFSSFGQKTDRKVEPLQLWFKDKTWYLKTFCLIKEDYRVFKLSRMKKLQLTEFIFERTIFEFINSKEREDEVNTVELKLYISEAMAYRVYDEFDEGCIWVNEDGSFEVKVSYPENEWVYGYILSFGNFAEVLEPVRIRDIISNRLEETLNKYRK